MQAPRQSTCPDLPDQLDHSTSYCHSSRADASHTPVTHTPHTTQSLTISNNATARYQAIEIAGPLSPLLGTS
jgi:hypothetical protein